MMGFDPGRFEAAVLTCFQEQASREVRAEADHFVKTFTNGEDGWRFILMALPQFENGRVRFVLLNSLNSWLQQRWSAVPPDGRRQLMQMLMNWVRANIGHNSENVNVIRSKVAQTLVLLFVQEFPHNWPTFFDELLSTQQLSALHKDLFLRVSDAIDEMVVSLEIPRTPDEIARNAKIKDAMRATALPKIVAAWFGILSATGEDVKLKAFTLHVVMRYVSWIDIGFFASQPFMAMMVAFLGVEPLQRKTVKLLTAITEKKMPALDKLELIRRFGLLQMCHQCRPAGGSRFAVHLSRWINVLGKCVLDGVAAVRATAAAAVPGEGDPQRHVKAAEDMLDACVMLMLTCMKSLQKDAAVEVIDFATRCVGALKTVGLAHVRASDKAWLQELLGCVAKLLMYDSEFDFGGDGDDADDDEELAEWLDRRDKISNVFKAIGRLDASLCTGLVRSMCESLIPRHASTPWNAVEGTLYLMMCLGEVLVHEGATEMKNQFRPFLALALQYDLAGNASFVVAKATFEVILRFFRYLPTDAQSLNLIVQMTESRGIRHAHPAVRKRAMLTFNKVAQLFGHQLVALVPSMLQSLRGMLVPISTQTSDGGYFAFQLTLYESLGLLIGQNADDTAQPQQVEAVLGPVAGELRRLVAGLNAAALGMSQMQLCVMATRLVEVVVAFCKGFSGIVNRRNRTKDLFVDVFGTVVALRRKNLGDEDLQGRCLQLMHRMVELLQHEFLLHLEPIVQLLLLEGGVAGAQDFLKLMGQLVSRFGTNFQPRLAMILAPLTRRVFDYVVAGEHELARQAAQSGGAVQLSELGREVRELRTSYYGFLLVLTRNQELSSVLATADNTALLEAVLGAVKQGTLWWGQPREQKDCWNIMMRLVEILPGVRPWFVREMVPVLLQSPCLPVFPFEAGEYVIVMRTMCVAQRDCLLHLGDDFAPLLLAHLVSMQLDESTRNQYVALLRAEDRESFIDFYTALLRRWRKQHLIKQR